MGSSLDTGLERRLPVSVTTLDIERFQLDSQFKTWFRQQPYKLGFDESKFGEIVYHRTYSRIKDNTDQENFYDTCIRVIEGLFTIRHFWYTIHHLPFDWAAAQERAKRMAISLLKLQWSPPGRGFWAMGTDYVYDYGSSALNNCGFIEINDLVEDLAWGFEFLLAGTGVGFQAGKVPQKLHMPGLQTRKYEILDCREDWVYSTQELLLSYTKLGYPFPIFDYSRLRSVGQPIHGFGGTASGPQALILLHNNMQHQCEKYICGEINWTTLVTDLMNIIGVAVVAGSARRSAEISLCSPHDTEFLDLKDYHKNPSRAEWGFMSNNSVVMSERNDFLQIPNIIKRIINNGEPGIMNLLNVQRFARIGDESYGPDSATGMNPCGEIALESAELCCLSDVYPSHCSTRKEFLQAVDDACFYASTVSLYPTTSQRTNEVIARNHRIGISLDGVAEWVDTWTLTKCVRWMKDGYHLARKVNAEYNRSAGVAPSIRITTVKPAGTVSQLAGVTNGMHFPHFNYALRRMIISMVHPLVHILSEAGYPCEPQVEFVPKERAMQEGRSGTSMSAYFHYAPEGMVACESLTSMIFEIPIKNEGVREARDVSAWEQFALLATLQREWADNSVSCTILFDPETEGRQLEQMVAQFLPVIKSVSILPHSANGVYPQMPYSYLTKEEYYDRISMLKPIDWTQLTNSDGQDSKFCENDKCDISAFAVGKFFNGKEE